MLVTIWKTPPVVDEPVIRLSCWTIRQVLDYSFFCGYNEEGCEGRVSTIIELFDPVSRKGATRSGRIYELIGGPGRHPDAEYVWDWWCKSKNISEKQWKDVTLEWIATKIPQKGSP